MGMCGCSITVSYWNGEGLTGWRACVPFLLRWYGRWYRRWKNKVDSIAKYERPVNVYTRKRTCLKEADTRNGVLYKWHVVRLVWSRMCLNGMKTK